MARGPQGQYRPGDPLGVAAAVIRIATGESDEEAEAARPAAKRAVRKAASTMVKPLSRNKKIASLSGA